ncbi:UNVERIFIED_CONTAM: epsP [Trichonephila clavipes]
MWRGSGFRRLRLPDIRSVLVVCIGNICRSPMAEALLKRELDQNVHVSSAGLGAMVGHPADEHAQTLMDGLGLSIRNHRARQLTQALISSHELILVMTARQKDMLQTEYPSARGRVYRICHWQPADVADPYQKERSAFESALVLIRQGVADWAERLK